MVGVLKELRKEDACFAGTAHEDGHFSIWSKFAGKISLMRRFCRSSVSMSHTPLNHTDQVLERLHSVSDCHVHVDRVLDSRLMMSGSFKAN